MKWWNQSRVQGEVMRAIGTPNSEKHQTRGGLRVSSLLGKLMTRTQEGKQSYCSELTSQIPERLIVGTQRMNLVARLRRGRHFLRKSSCEENMKALNWTARLRRLEMLATRCLIAGLKLGASQETRMKIQRQLWLMPWRMTLLESNDL